MDMEAQMIEDTKWRKLREQWATKVADTESQPKITDQPEK